jgi:Rod binding domain-containing protein
MESQSVAAGLKPGLSPGRLEEQKLKEVAQEFEAILIAAMLKDAQQSEHAGPLAGGLSHDLYQQLFTDGIAKAIARSGGIGLGKMLERQLRGMLGAGTYENRLKISQEPADSSNRSSVQSQADR